MPKARFMVIPAVHLILLKDNKILLLKRCNTGYEDGNYSVIAGHKDAEETVLNAMIREAKEEGGIDIANLEVVHVMHRKQKEEERVDLFILAKKWTGAIKNMEPDKCSDLSWFDLDNLPGNMVPYVRYAIDKIMHKNFYSEFGWSV